MSCQDKSSQCSDTPESYPVSGQGEKVRQNRNNGKNYRDYVHSGGRSGGFGKVGWAEFAFL